MDKGRINIDYASQDCLDFLIVHDHYVTGDVMEKKVQNGEVIIARGCNNIIGWLRFGYFWDQIPFMNMLFIFEGFRGKGIGTELVRFWEEEMLKKGFKMVLTSTLSNETAQHFYRKLGYKDSGCLLLEGEPSLEIILRKELIK